MTIEELEKIIGLKYEDCSFVTRMAILMTCIKESK